MDHLNGTGQSRTVLGARRRVNARPKTIEFEVETVNDGVQVLKGYCRGRADGYGPCPTNVTIEVSAAFDVWREKAYRPATDKERRAWDDHVAACAERGEAPGESPIDDEGLIFDVSQEARLTLHRDLLLAVMPGLDQQTASVLAGEDGDWEAILTDLGWFSPTPTDAVEAAGPEGEGEAPSPPTGASSSPASAPSTASGRASS